MELEEQRGRVGAVQPGLRLIIAIVSASTNSQRATGMPCCTMAMAASTAAVMLGKAHTAAAICSGMPRTLSVSSVMMPSVPSEPMKRWVRS